MLLLLAVSLVLSACTITTNSKKAGPEAAVYLTLNRGDAWLPMINVANASGQLLTLGDLSVNLITLDPQDSKAVYLASDQGLFYTYNIANGWNSVNSLPKTAVNDVRVDFQNKCIVYAALSNRVYRSDDCSRTWTQIYFDNNQGVNVNTIVIDHYNNRNLYIGTSRGDIIKSIDSGASWRTIQRLNEGVVRLLMSPLDSRQLFVATVKNHLYSFSSNSVTDTSDPTNLEKNFLVSNWTSLNDFLKNFNLGSNFRGLVITNDAILFLATDNLILRSQDSGFTWDNIKLIPPEKDAVITSLAVNPKNPAEMYYITKTTFFRSLDGGTTWTNKKLPVTTRVGRELVFDFTNPGVLYLGTLIVKD